MARTRPENAQRRHPQSGTEMDTTWKKVARTAKDNMATDSNGRAEREGAVMGEAQASAKDSTLRQNIVVALCPTGDEENKLSDTKWHEMSLQSFINCGLITFKYCEGEEYC